jgi:hypothetical protein
MTDIVERLRQRDEYEQVLDHANRPYGLAKSLAHDAADEIERLRAERDEAQAEANAGRQAEQDADRERDEAIAERDRLRDALQGRSWNEINGYWIDGLNRARAALKEIS